MRSFKLKKMKTKYKGITIPDYFIVIKWIAKGDKCASDLQKDLNITYKHLHDIKHTFIDMGWVDITIVKRKHIMNLTNKGKIIEKIVNNFLKAMNIYEEDILKSISKGKIKKKENVDIEKLKKDILNYND